MRRLRCEVLAWAAIALELMACGSVHGATPAVAHGSNGARTNPEAPHCEYDVSVVQPTALLDVRVRCPSLRTTGWDIDAALAPFVTNVEADGHTIAGSGGRFADDGGTGHLAYRVDLDRAARELDDVDQALAIGASILAPASSFLFRPEPAPSRTVVTVRVHASSDSTFATGLEAAGDAFTLGAHELRSATYSVFGKFESTILRPRAFTGGSAEVRVVWLDGAPPATRDDRARWVNTAVEAVSGFFGGFPVSRALLALAPIPGRSEVVFGKLLPAGGNAIAVLVGEEATRNAFDRDWILVHELFHLGFPSFVGEGAWLDEGLATYFEPIVRARVGLLSEAAAWREITRGMQRGVHLCETTGVENYGDDFRAVYWGGAVVSLLADVEARRRTAGARGLEDGLRALLARGGNARSVWRVADAIRAIDEGIGFPVLAMRSDEYRFHGSPVPLQAVLEDLGVGSATSGVELRDGARLAAIRRAVIWGSPAKVSGHATGPN